MSKKQPTPEYGSYGSYHLTEEQIKQAIRAFEWDFLEDDRDEKAGTLIALLRSFTFTTDNAERETMLLAAESMLMPFTRACEDALKELGIKTHQAIIREGGTQ